MNNRIPAPFCSGAVLILISAVYSYFMPIANAIRSLFLISDALGLDHGIQALLPTLLGNILGGLPTLILLLILCIRLMRKKRDTANGAIAVVLAVFSFLGILSGLILRLLSKVSGANSSAYPFSALALTVFYVLLAVQCFSSAKPQSGRVSRLWFLPGIVAGFHAVVYLMETIAQRLADLPYTPEFRIQASIIISVLLSNLIPIVLRIVGWFLVGKWLSSPTQPVTVSQQPDMACTPNPTLNNSDKYDSAF